MDKTEYENLRRETLEKQEQYLRENPEIGAWVRKKKLLLRFLQGYWILHFMLYLLIMVQQQSLTWSLVGMEIFKLLFQLLWMLIWVNPRGRWQLGVMLYVSAAFNLALLMQQGQMLLKTIHYLLSMPFLSMLIYGALMLLEVLVPFLLLGIAVYLTAPKKHREWSDQAWAMYSSTAPGLNDVVNKR